MAISIQTSFAFELERPTDVLLQFEAADIPEQRILSAETCMTEAEHCAHVPAQDDIGERIWLRAEGHFEVDYNALVEPQRLLPDIETLRMLDPHDMPGEAVEYLFDSRYCPADKFQPFVEAEFGKTQGGARIAAIREWIERNFSYQPGTSDARTGALDSFVERRGICRDYAHVMVTMARASTIPARYVACYAPGVDPPDFHAVAEVFLDDPTTDGGGAWHLVDATGMANPAETAKIGIGRDAADVSFLTSFGPNNFLRSSVKVSIDNT
ncbi:Transglutaminase-like superfamily protein [Altererythrobacter xiamenensis]|uniref:Transglutaminase-like superfamily protein n=1 Tax=Altererythrobacter xiamenensis TaxID=1316679 RepID=A0A1Y6EK80_9SPHN|nr:transglutaminase family protein [Altererythrobacter xiamenensis]SMQ62786.1 Transglutaminase-like superfamily protein [Altererythrobacter xiamenensis]